MLSAAPEGGGPIDATRRAKLAFVYVRQSTADQVRQHAESTALQYRLVERAVALGWPRERVSVIDDDLGKSGRTSAERGGFQRLIAEIGLGHAGLVLSLDASRLARNNRDWHQLLELCSLFGVLLADGERVYDPGAYHDRLLLGLSGIMSEAELHQIRLRLHAGELQKASRGELRLPLPAGLVWQQGGGIALNPDEEIQARLRFVFARFTVLGTAKAVMRDLQRHGLLLPTRPLRGPAPHAVTWVPPDSARVLHILHNPAYAGAYVYGQRRSDPTRRRTPLGRGATVRVAPGEWAVCLRDAHPAYISWEEFVANQARLAGNVPRYERGNPGAVRRGPALLAGIAACARCGRRMGVRYSGPAGTYPVYHCSADQAGAGAPRCQEVRARPVDAAIEALLLETLTPERISLAVAAVGALEEETRLLERQWALRRERARHEAERARRQYDAVEPENRLVARTLERAWEERLRAAEAIEAAHEAWCRDQPGPLSDGERGEVLALAGDLVAVWGRAGPEERKRILRLVIADVALDARRDLGTVVLRVTWCTGAVDEHPIRRSVRGYAECADAVRIEARLRALNAAGLMDADVATALNAEGFLTAHGQPFRGGNVHLLRQRWGIPTVKINGTSPNPPRWPDGTYSVAGAAARLGVTAQTVFKWLHRGRLKGRQSAPGQPWQISLPDRTADLPQRRITKRSRSAAS